MPAKNSVKEYIPNGFYHIYNRGVEKRNICLDEQDYGVFLSYLKTYLLPKDSIILSAIINSKDSTWSEKDKAIKELKLKNFSGNIDLLAYALMPNHFHFLVKQTEAEAIDSFMNAISTRYVLYFNKKYHRVGPLYQGVYKAVLVSTEEQFLHLSRYIHLNPPKESNFPSSLPDYLGLKKTAWLKPEAVLSYFSRTNSNNTYASFMGESQYGGEFIAPIAIDLNDN